MPIPKLAWPEELSGNCTLLPIAVELIPAIGGLLETLEWRAAWSTDADYEAGLPWVIGLEEELVSMECTNAIVDAIEKMRLDLLQSLDVCCQVQSGPGWPEPPLDTQEEGEGDPPPGFDTWEEWKDYKCQAVQQLLDDILESLDKLDDLVEVGVALSSTVVGSVIATLSLGWGLVLYLASVLVAVLIDETMESIIQGIETNYEELLCTLYDGSSAVYAKVSVDQFIDGLAYSGFVRSAMKTVIGAARLNAIWEGTAPASPYYSPDACDICPGMCPMFIVGHGTVVIEGPPTWVINSVGYQQSQHICGVFNYMGADYCNPQGRRSTIDAYVGYVYGGQQPGFHLMKRTTQTVYSGGVPWPAGTCGDLWEINGHPDFPFTLTITVAELCDV